MTRSQKLLVIFLRMAVGWFLLYQGITAILNPDWSLLPFIQPAYTFPEFYASISAQDILPYITYLVKGLFVISGALLIAGLFVRIGAFLGIILMLFFYFPGLSFPYVGSGYYIIDNNLLLAILLAYLFVIRAGEFFGLGTMFRFSRY